MHAEEAHYISRFSFFLTIFFFFFFAWWGDAGGGGLNIQRSVIRKDRIRAKGSWV